MLHAVGVFSELNTLYVDDFLSVKTGLDRFPLDQIKKNIYVGNLHGVLEYNLIITEHVRKNSVNIR